MSALTPTADTNQLGQHRVFADCVGTICEVSYCLGQLGQIWLPVIDTPYLYICKPPVELGACVSQVTGFRVSDRRK
jgi:hypothetical protein